MRQHFFVLPVGKSFQHCFLTSSMEKGKIDYGMNFVYLSLVVSYVLPHSGDHEVMHYFAFTK